MDVTIRQSESKEINGAKRVGDVPIVFNALKNKFGQPHDRNVDGKIKFEWNLTIEWINNGLVVADCVVRIYDYYNCDVLFGEFNIGGHNGMALDVAYALLDDDHVTPDNILTDKVKAKLMEIGEVNFPHIWEDCNA